MSLERIVRMRQLVERLCQRIDAGEVHPTEQEMAAVAWIVRQEAGPLAHTLLVELASRCKNGRAALKDIAQ